MLLEAKNISFNYTKKDYIFKNVSFFISSGEIVGLIGESGCGKTTFAKILAGFIKPTIGCLMLDGREYKKIGYNAIQLILQNPENAVNPKWKMKKILNEGWNPNEKVLKDIGIKNEWLDRKPSELSLGELQRFCLARALGPKTKFLIADEITTMLDTITQAQIWKFILEEVKSRNLGVIAISHDVALLNQVCTRVLETTTLFTA